MKMRRLSKVFRRGQKGFTLIELLVVVAILGILAAVVIPNVMNMMGTGTVQAANTEAHDVEIAVLAGMVATDSFELTASGTIGDGRNCSISNSEGTDISTDVLEKLNGSLECQYTLDTDGHILSVSSNTGKWQALTYTEFLGWTE